MCHNRDFHKIGHRIVTIIIAIEFKHSEFAAENMTYTLTKMIWAKTGKCILLNEKNEIFLI